MKGRTTKSQVIAARRQVTGMEGRRWARDKPAPRHCGAIVHGVSQVTREIKVPDRAAGGRKWGGD